MKEKKGGISAWIKESEIHEYGKIAKIVDMYDALTTKRSYSDAGKPLTRLR